MRNGQALAAAMLASVAALVCAGEVEVKEPQTGRKCVSLYAFDEMDAGRMRVTFHNICASQFLIRVQALSGVREKAIEPGTPEKPSKTSIICKSGDRCGIGKWQYEVSP